jgi:NAD(P)-dependent dehydrogenase (short-subunit alcohol dehydrogenase family)
MTRELDGLRLVVTGAAGGIGLAIGQLAAQRGARVVLADLKSDSAELAAREVSATGGEAYGVEVDVTDPASVQNLVEEAAGALGGIDVLVNNAGIIDWALDENSSVADFDPAHFSRVLAVNVLGPWLCSKAALPYLRESSRASILHAGSMASFVGWPGIHAYGASKGGILMLTKSMAAELAPDGIRVNCYCPGNVRSPMMQTVFDSAEDPEAWTAELLSTHLVRRFGEPSDIAELVCFLAGERSSYITGQSFVADGGTLAWRGTASQLPFQDLTGGVTS